MKKCALLLFMVLLLTSCGQAEPESPSQAQTVPPVTAAVPETETAALETTEETLIPASTEETLALSYDAYHIVYNIMTEGGAEVGTFQGIGPDGNLAWTYETQAYPMGQLAKIMPIGSYEGTYYLLEDGIITALDMTNGNILFENREFGGFPGPDAFCMDDYGYLYLAGYDGPDFFAMDSKGRTVSRVQDLSDQYCCPSRVEVQEGRIAVYMESDGKGNSGEFPCYIDITWYPDAQG